MARQKGSANLAASLEVLAGAPLDARETVKLIADLTDANSFPYKYLGLTVFVEENQKKYTLINLDTTQSSSWRLEGSDVDVPTKTSDLTNDSGFITAEDIPENVSDFTNDAGYITNADVPTKLSDLTNDEGFINNTVDNLVNYYKTSSTYSKAEIDALISAAKTGRFIVVNSLPTENIDTSAIYLVPKQDAVTGNTKDEYINLDGTTLGWEKIGTTDIDLSGYVTTQALNTKLEDYTPTSSLGAVATSNDYDDLNNKPTIPTRISDLTNDSDFVESNSLADVATSGDYEDLSNKPTIPDAIQVSVMPTASATYEGKTVQYIGTSTLDYTHNFFYECKENSGVYSWVNVPVQDGGGSGGDASLETDVTSNLAVGAIASGTTLAAGTTFTEFAQKLLVSEIAPTVGFSLSKSGNVVYGGSYTETLTVNVSAMGTAKKIKSIAWYEGNTLKQTDTIDSAVVGSWTYTMGTATTDTTTFKAIVTYTSSKDQDVSVTKTASINFYYNKFYGAVGSLTPDEATVEALSTALGTSKGGTYSFTVTAGRICYAYPKSLGALTSIKDGNGFSLFDSFTRTEQSYTQNGTTVAYYRYVLTDPTTVSSYSVIFA